MAKKDHKPVKGGMRPRTARAPRSPFSKSQTRLLEGAMAGGFAFVIGSVFLISSLQSFFLQTNQYASVVTSVLTDLVNGDRLANNLGGLTVNPLLVAAAQAKANDMAAKGYFAHTSPEGLDSWHWFKGAGYNFQNAGENLAVDFSDSADVERAWMNSPSHRENILNGTYTEVGIATASGYYQGRLTTFVVQMFGTPSRTAAVSQRSMTQDTPSEPTRIAQASRPDAEQVLGSTAKTPPKPKPIQKPAAVAVAGPAPVQVLGEETVAAVAPDSGQPVGALVRHASDWQVLATSPSSSMRYAYYFLALLIVLALAIDTGLEIRWHHRKRAFTAGALLAVMCGLFLYADYAVFGHATVALTNSAQESAML